MTREEFDTFADELREKLVGRAVQPKAFALVILADDDGPNDDGTLPEKGMYYAQHCAFGVLDFSDERRWMLIDTLFEFADKLDDAFPRPKHLDPTAN